MNRRAVMGWCTAWLIHIGVSGIVADDADRNIWILLRDKMDAEGQGVVWRDLGAGREEKVSGARVYKYRAPAQESQYSVPGSHPERAGPSA